MNQFSSEEPLLVAAGIAIVGGSIVIDSQVVAGCFVGAITATGVGYTLLKTRTHAKRLHNLIHVYPLASDIAIDAAVFALVGDQKERP